MDQDDAVKVMEGVAHLAGRLSSEQRSELLDLLGTMAESESDLAHREFLEGFQECFGLLDDAVRPAHHEESRTHSRRRWKPVRPNIWRLSIWPQGTGSAPF
ncbi:hypothetical protein [Streptomyces sp. CB01249]|uniref:hypothetical protein n=1 Tax=Streptomyces sp. CB01249 TaxID=1703929 RepID=UPI001F5224D6|nr:hypothetical protein [Streptomyces sp. CB01249]